MFGTVSRPLRIRVTSPNLPATPVLQAGMPEGYMPHSGGKQTLFEPCPAQPSTYDIRPQTRCEAFCAAYRKRST